MLFGGTRAFSQHIIKGRLVDEEQQALPSATVMLLNAEDSVLKSFGLSGADGKFALKSVPEGEFVLKATFPQRETMTKNVSVTGDQKEIDLGDLTILEKSKQLDDVEITAEMIPVQIKGDTVEYNAKAFKTQPNASVEDLIKRLPGMEVDSDGNVKAQGEDVQKVLVDGKEFFGNDPKVATKNLPADAIDKVQVFDKRSDMADFTGVDDGERTRTINLMLKEDRKNGYFGDVSAGYGTENRFRAKANLNRFSENSQLSFLGMGNNINEQPFSITDYVNFMGGISNLMSAGGMSRGSGNTVSLSPSDLGISFRGNGTGSSGISTTAGAGINYNVDLGKKTDLQTSYFYNFLRKDLEQSTYRENIFTENTFVTEDTTDQVDKNQNHRVNLRLEHRIDSSAKLILTGAASLNGTVSNSNSITQSFTGETIENANDRNEATDGNNQQVNGNLLYLKRFKKVGRSLATQLSFGYTGQLKNWDIFAENSFFLDTIGFVTDTLDQDQNQDQGVLDYGGKITWTEPVGNFKFLEGYYAHQENANDLVKDFFNYVPAGGTNAVLDSSLSNRYDMGYSYDQAGASFRYARKTFNFNVGLAAQRSALNGEIGFQDTTISKLFYNALPSMNLSYQIKKGSRVRLRYNTQVNAPSVSQLSPVVDNSNPLSIRVGNPDLTAEYQHNLNLNYMIFDQFSFTSLFTMIRASFTQNNISTATSVDTLLRQVTTFVNVAQDWNVTWFAHFSTPVRKLGIKFNIDPNINWNRGITLLNGLENPTTRLTSTVNASIENRKKEHFDARIGARLTHNITQYELDASRDQTYLNSSYYGELTLYFKKGFTVNSEFNYNIYSGGGFAQNTTVPLLKANVGKTFLKADRGELRLSAFDILNQNAGIDRTTQVNYLEESRYNTLGRYFMLSFTYKIVTVGK